MGVKSTCALLATLILTACTTSSQTAQRPAATIEDGAILAAVKAKLSADNPSSVATLGVAVHNGDVTLRGSVLTPTDRSNAERDAHTVPGVKAVVNDLVVNPNAPRPSQQLSDLALAARIDAELAAQLGFTHIGVHVDRGVATLDGSVPDAKTKTIALATVRGTQGVRNVIDRVAVQRP